MKTTLTRLLREPLLHFMAIGALIFALNAYLNGDNATAPDEIVISPARIDQIVTGYQAIWKTKPSEAEIDKLIEGEIRGEIYYRDAVALRLDQNDSVVRQRMVQKNGLSAQYRRRSAETRTRRAGGLF